MNPIDAVNDATCLIHQAQELLNSVGLTLAIDTSLDDPSINAVPNVDYLDQTDPESPWANDDIGPVTSAQAIFDQSPILFRPITINSPDRMVINRSLPDSWDKVKVPYL